MPKITKRLVDGLGPDQTGKVVRDDELTGFAVRLNADGSRDLPCGVSGRAGEGFPDAADLHWPAWRPDA